MDKKLIAELKEKLEKEKTSLQKELESFAKKDENLANDWNARYPNHEDKNIEEEANEAQEYDSLLSLEHSLELKLKDVDSALGKIKKGNYGICEKCGKKIDKKRLQACLEARLCMKCK
ncbi:MAG: transcriptional regulator, TraR/DksA family [Parcubacteria group bacterium Licking1014_1]|nr:MAG: transcriptional regulator, TraR/DksA family [Parcubacteria group bacterium Licking1014_1]